MSLLDDLNVLASAPPSRGGGVRCGVGLLLDRLPERESASLVQLVDKTTIPAAKITEVLRDNGFHLSPAQIQSHRRRLRGTGCRCPLEAS